MYDPVANAWAPIANMPSARNSIGAATAPSGRMYVIGANQNNEEYDPLTNSWTVRANLPTGRLNLGVVRAGNGRIYALGGFLSFDRADNEEYTPPP